MSPYVSAASAAGVWPSFIFSAARRFVGTIGVLPLAALGYSEAQAQTVDSTMPAVTVTGTRDPVLDTETSTGSRLGLTPREIPAAIDVLDARTMEERGLDQAKDAVATMPGILAGGSPGNPFSLSMRGLSLNQVTLLRDGRYLGPATMVARPQNAFNLDRIEVLKGPASVLYGQGAIGGAVNMITRQPTFTSPRFDGQVTYGSFDTLNLWAGGGGKINDRVAIRADVSRTSRNGFVQSDDPNSLNFTAAMLFKASDDFDIRVGVDVLHDRLSPYFGTPLVPASMGTQPMSGLLTSSRGLVVDSRTRFNNYNVVDNVTSSSQVLPSVDLTWRVSPDVTLRNYTYFFHADRQWLNAEVYDAITTPGSVQRDRFQVAHVQNQVGNITDVTFRNSPFGLDNKTTVGVEYMHIDFERRRGFPAGDTVDLFNPTRGMYGPSDFRRRAFTRIDSVAGFIEDVLALTGNLRLVTGLRWESFKLMRENFDADGSFNAGQSFSSDFYPINYRASLIYDVAPGVSLFGQYATAQDPSGNANIFLVNANQNFNLSDSREIEVGVKANFDRGRGRALVALYDIERKNVLTTVAPDVVATIGSQQSRGVEVSADYRITDNWQVSGNAAYTYARFGQFADSTGDFSGNTPANVPTWMGYLWTRYANVANSRFDLGAALQYVGERTGDNANTLRLDNYALLHLFSTYHLTEGVDLTFRVNNVFDKAYVAWADINYSGTQVLLGAPRSFFATLRTRF